MNDYYETTDGTVNTTILGGFKGVTSWAVENSDGELAELYIVVTY